ncbi:ABC transporter permease [Paraburkholderia sp. A2WS-5]|uniref:ABC transporter permease n=1 Tax=unclassified Paraburkholderia TaxID=2615204 RepID=UPI003B7E1C66
MTTSADIRTIVISGLKGATDAGQSVFSPFDWPTSQNAYPCILVRAPRERKQSLGKNAPLFSVTTTVEIVARTVSTAAVGDEGSAVALAAAEKLKGQIEVTLINNTSLWVDVNGAQIIEQFASVESEISTSSDGEWPMAELQMRMEIEFTQGPEDFYPIAGVQLAGIDMQVKEPPGTVQPGFSIDFPPPIS